MTKPLTDKAMDEVMREFEGKLPDYLFKDKDRRRECLVKLDRLIPKVCRSYARKVIENLYGIAYVVPKNDSRYETGIERVNLNLKVELDRLTDKEPT